MIKVIRQKEKKPIQDKISTQDITALDTGSSIILTEAVKQSIEINYNASGYADMNTLDLGVQYDHRVTWLHFNLDNLIWNLNSKKKYDENTKYNHYTFKIAFSKLDSVEPKDWIWEFDGIDFEIPRTITQEAGSYSFVLIIEEYKGDSNPGNIIDNPDQTERFVTAPLKGKVYSSFYTPDLNVEGFYDPLEDTLQKSSLTKPRILCSLTDHGELTADTNILGQKYDSFIRYLKFNPNRITAHLNDFHTFVLFKQDDKFYSSMFEITTPDDPLDDYSDSHPIIAWIPTSVYETAGTWQVAIISMAGNLDAINNNEGNGDYYFYVSKQMKMKVESNTLTKEILSQNVPISVTTNLVTDLGELVMTTDNNIYQTKKTSGE